jgi:BASS family bile acid:Na+ symporter
MASNVISYLAGADAAYSISLTTSSTLLSPLLTPFFTYLFAHTIIPIKFWDMFFSIIRIVILPLLAGFALRYAFHSAVEKIKEFFPALSTIFIAFICGLVVALNSNNFGAVSLLIFVAIVLHNFLGLFFGYLAGLLYRLDIRRARTLSIEVGMQNAGLGAVLSLKYFSDLTALPNALFATWCVITASVLAVIWNKNKQENSYGNAAGTLG